MVAWSGKERGVGRHRRKVGQGLVQLHFQGVIVDRPHAQLGGRLLARQDLLCVHDLGELDEPAVGRGGCGIDRAPPAVDEVMRGHGVALRPRGVLAQREGVGRVVVRRRVARGHAGNEVAVPVLAQQALEEVPNHVESGDVLVELRVERGELVEQAVGEGLIVRQRLACHRMGSGRLRLRDDAQGQGNGDGCQSQRGEQSQSRCSHLPAPFSWGVALGGSTRHVRRITMAQVGNMRSRRPPPSCSR